MGRTLVARRCFGHPKHRDALAIRSEGEAHIRRTGYKIRIAGTRQRDRHGGVDRTQRSRLATALRDSFLEKTHVGSVKNRVVPRSAGTAIPLAALDSEICDLPLARPRIQADFVGFLTGTAPAFWSRVAAPSTSYEPRYPAQSAQIVHDHFETFRAQAANLRDGEGLPRFVAQEFRDFLRCGWLVGGFGRSRCGVCGLDRLVPFACKGRALCPSSGGRRMAERAAHLLDHVFPDASVRQ